MTQPRADDRSGRERTDDATLGHHPRRTGDSFLGEPLFRMASLMLESGTGRPGVIREIAVDWRPQLGEQP